MIGRDADAALKFLEGFREAVQLDPTSSDHVEEFDELAATVQQSGFPGAVLAWPRSGKCTVYYAVAVDALEWRRLRPLLMAFAGPTVSSFRGWAEPLHLKAAPEAFLASRGLHVIARILPEKGQVDDAMRKLLRRSLARMVVAVGQAPPSAQEPPVSTGQLLAQFVDCLNGNDRPGAELALSRCQTECRVDALNLSFLRVQLHAHFADWHAITRLPEFNSLLHTRKPPDVSARLLEALYQVHLATREAEGFQALLDAWEESVRPIARPLLQTLILPCISRGGLTLHALEALKSSTRSPEIERTLWERRAEYGLVDQVERFAPADSTPTAAPSRNDVAAAQAALVTADQTGSLTVLLAALEQLRGLATPQREEVLSSEPFRQLWKDLLAPGGGDGPPTGWIEWINRLSDPKFESSTQIVQQACAEWPARDIVDAAEAEAVAQALDDVPPGIAMERLADALPHLAAWLKDDSGYPRPTLTRLYEAMLFQLVGGARRGSAVLESAGLMIRALLQIGLSAAAYRQLLQDVIDLAGAGLGAKNVYWLLDLVEETVLNNASDKDSRLWFWQMVVSRLTPLTSQLSVMQRVTLERLAVGLGWDASEFSTPQTSDDVEARQRMRALLAQKTVAIYTLTESAGRQAAETLQVIAPDVKVVLSHEHDGTGPLKNLARTADWFVLAPSSAKHAATTFIQQHRPPDKPTVFAAGRGASSILRALEDGVSAAVH